MLVINILIVLAISGCVIYKKDYEREFLNNIKESEHKLNFLYPISLFLLDAYKKIANNTFKSKNIAALKMLNINEDIKVVSRLYYCEKIAMVIFIIFVFNIFGILFTIGDSSVLIDGTYILRPEQGEENKEYVLDAVIKDDNLNLYEEIKIDIGEKRYNSDEIAELFIKSEEYIRSNMLGDNISMDEVHNKLNLIKLIPENNIKVSWELDKYGLISLDGEINEDGYEGGIPEEGILINIIAKLKYYEYGAECEFWLRVLPKVISYEEELREELLNLLELADKDNLTNDKIELPMEVNNKVIEWGEKKSSSLLMTLFGIILGVLIFILKDEDLYKKVLKRDEEMLIDYSEIVNKFTLLISAGMTIKGAWGKIASDYMKKVDNNSKAKRFAYEEIMTTWNELSIGISEYKAYDNFGRRTGLHQYLKFSTLIVQNLKKGSKGLSELLELEVVDAFEERKQMAKRLGEEAGTKLLMPMFLMLLVVLIIIMVPAFMSFGI